MVNGMISFYAVGLTDSPHDPRGMAGPRPSTHLHLSVPTERHGRYCPYQYVSNDL